MDSVWELTFLTITDRGSPPMPMFISFSRFDVTAKLKFDRNDLDMIINTIFFVVTKVHLAGFASERFICYVTKYVFFAEFIT